MKEHRMLLLSLVDRSRRALPPRAPGSGVYVVGGDDEWRAEIASISDEAIQVITKHAFALPASIVSAAVRVTSERAKPPAMLAFDSRGNGPWCQHGNVFCNQCGDVLAAECSLLAVLARMDTKALAAVDAEG